MAVNDVVRARIDPATKLAANSVLKEIGLTASDAFRLMMVRVAAEKRLPFEPFIPNAETAIAIQDARDGKTVKAGKSIKSVTASLDDD